MNMLRPDFECDSSSVGPVLLTAAPASDSFGSSGGPVVLMSALVEESNETESSPSRAVTKGCINNPQVLSVLDNHLPHLSVSE